MRKFFIAIPFLFLVFNLAGSEKYLYDIKILDKDENFRQLFKAVDPWSFYIDESGDHHYRVATDEKTIKNFLEMPANIEKLLPLEKFKEKRASLRSAGNYHDFDSAMAFIDNLEVKYPELAKIYDLGETLNGNPIRAIKISSEPDKNLPQKTEVLYVGMHHAREWISVEVTLHLAEFILENYTKSKRVHNIVNESEIWIIPILNGDGFKYSWTNDRFWRKNRRKIVKNGTTYFGVDPNRNYDANFGGEGASSDPESDVYHGDFAFSERETDIIRNLVGDSLTPPLNGWVDDMKGFIDFHSYSQLILYPYGHTNDRSPKHELMKTVAEKMALLIKDQSGKTYLPQQSNELYVASGGSSDWFHLSHDYKTTFTIELRPDGSAMGGFDLPASEIEGTVKENIPAALYYLEYLLEENPNVNTDSNNNSIVDYYEQDCGAFSCLPSTAARACSDSTECKPGKMDAVCMTEWPAGYCSSLCEKSSDCSIDSVCKETPEGEKRCLATCTKNDEIRESYICSMGIIKPECKRDDDCPPGFTCALESGLCQSSGTKVTGESCTEDSECSDYGFCMEGYCSEDCTISGSCSGDGICTLYRDEEKLTYSLCLDRCRQSDDCATGAFCKDVIVYGVCSKKCENDDECKEGENCDPIAGVCSNEKEYGVTPIAMDDDALQVDETFDSDDNPIAEDNDDQVTDYLELENDEDFSSPDGEERETPEESDGPETFPENEQDSEENLSGDKETSDTADNSDVEYGKDEISSDDSDEDKDVPDSSGKRENGCSCSMLS